MSDLDTTIATTNGSANGEEFDWEGDPVEAEMGADGKVSRSRIDLPRYKRVLSGIVTYSLDGKPIFGKQRVWRVPTGDIMAPIVKRDEDGNPVINPRTKRKVLENPIQAGRGELEFEDAKGVKAAATALGFSVLIEPRHIVEGQYAGMTALRIVPRETTEMTPENEYARQVGADAGEAWGQFLDARERKNDENLPEEERTAAKEAEPKLLSAAVELFKVRAIWQQARKDENYELGTKGEDGRYTPAKITGPGYDARWDGKTLDKEKRRPVITVTLKQAPAKAQGTTKAPAAPAAS